MHQMLSYMDRIVHPLDPALEKELKKRIRLRRLEKGQELPPDLYGSVTVVTKGLLKEDHFNDDEWGCIAFCFNNMLFQVGDYDDDLIRGTARLTAIQPSTLLFIHDEDVKDLQCHFRTFPRYVLHGINRSVARQYMTPDLLKRAPMTRIRYIRRKFKGVLESATKEDIASMSGMTVQEVIELIKKLK